MLDPDVWSDLAWKKIHIPARVRKLVDRAQRRSNGGHKTYHIYLRNLKNPLVSLPVELIFKIANLLRQTSKLSFSLASKRLRAVLIDDFDAPWQNSNEQLAFLHLLERDLPAYLTCRRCLVLYRWSEPPLAVAQGHACPGRETRFLVPRLNGSTYYLCATHQIQVSQEVIDLIARCYRWGKGYGIPLSYLDHQCGSVPDTYQLIPDSRRTEGRIVNGHFMLYRSSVSIDHISLVKSQTIFLSICSHSSWDVAFQLSRRPWDGRMPLDFGTMECDVCPTDFRVMLTPLDKDDTVRVELRIWHDYGDCSVPNPNISPIFKRRSELYASVNQPRRNLEGLFDSAQARNKS